MGANGRAIPCVRKDKVLRTLDANRQTGELSTDLGVPHGDKLSPRLFLLSLADP